MNANQIKQQLENAFAPYTCKAELLDYDEFVRFKIMDNSNLIFESDRIEITSINNSGIQEFIKSIKSTVKLPAIT